ncbi:hypothetical protein EVH07_11975 [Salmonella enterica subsp. enterica serovar Newport]|nr:hypothetical protein [Salmonella enterica subsp. enterica serovar Newport]
MGLKLLESLTLDQQQALLDEVVISAVKQGIIKDDTLINRAEMIHHLVVCLGEANHPRKKIVMFEEGVIDQAGRCALLRLAESHPGVKGKDVKTSVPVTPYTKGVEELSWFETINTIYIMSPNGKPVLDMRRWSNDLTTQIAKETDSEV